MRPPNAPRIFRDWLRTMLSVRVEQTMVTDPPASWVRVSGTGGRGLAAYVIWDVVLTCECWAPTPAAAWALAADVCHAAAAWQGTATETPVYAVDVGVPRDFPDPDTGGPRFLVDVFARLRTIDS